MARSFRLPDLGEGIVEGEVLAVHVKAGQMVKEGDIILEVETDKAAVEIPSPFTGKVMKVMVKAGDMVAVGDVMMVMDVAGEDQVEDRVESAPVAPSPEPDRKTGDRKEPVPASPATRRLSREMGVDLRKVTPTGHGGIVTSQDVKSFAENQKQTITAKPSVPSTAAPEDQAQDRIESLVFGQEPELPDFSKWGPVQKLPFRSIRRATARQMATAWSLIPHVNSQETVDITRIEDFRKRHKAQIEASGGRLTLTVFTLKAVATALKTYPQFNASLDIKHQQIIRKDYYHIGVAVNTEHGLIVPLIRDVDRKSIKELAVELSQVVMQTQTRKISRDALQGGTFTITNAGAMGGGFFTPIINYPEVAILGMGQARMQPAVVTTERGSTQIEPRLIMPLVLCIDHRVLDGADAIKFLQLIKEALQDPDELLMSMV